MLKYVWAKSLIQWWIFLKSVWIDRYLFWWGHGPKMIAKLFIESKSFHSPFQFFAPLIRKALPRNTLMLIFTSSTFKTRMSSHGSPTHLQSILLCIGNCSDDFTKDANPRGQTQKSYETGESSSTVCPKHWWNLTLINKKPGLGHYLVDIHSPKIM